MIKTVFEFLLGDWFERIVGKYQRDRITRRAVALNPGGHLTYTDDALAFHAQSSEADIVAKYENNKSKLTL